MPDTLTFQVGSGGSLADAFADAPAAVRAFFRRGFNVLSKVSQEKFEQLVRIAAASLETSHLTPQVPGELASGLGISEPEAIALLAAASMFVAMLTHRHELPEALVKAAEEAKVLESADVPAAAALAQVIRGVVSVAVPVVVAYLKTDSSKDLWFQLTRGQLERLIAQLELAKRNLEAAERWIEKPSRGSDKNV